MSDIAGPLEMIRKRLNEFIQNADPRHDPWVILANLVDHGGTPYEPAQGKVVMFLANIQRETAISTNNPNVPARSSESYAVVAPPLYIDLFLLFVANFEGPHYTQGLGAISRTISFFQQNPWFNHENLPGLDPAIEKLVFQMTNLEPLDLNFVMSLAGTKYLPSAYYKVRMIPFQAGAMQAETPAVQGLQNTSDPDDGQPAAVDE
jgi:hypothetical protein